MAGVLQQQESLGYGLLQQIKADFAIKSSNETFFVNPCYKRTGQVMVAFGRNFTVYSQNYNHSPLNLEQFSRFSRALQTSACIHNVTPPQHKPVLKYFLNATFQTVSLKSEKTQLNLICIYISQKISCFMHANFL